MAVLGALARVRREVFADDLPIAAAVDQLCKGCGCAWRDRLLTPLVTLRLFVLQVLHGNASIAHLRQLCGVDFAPSSYCEARQRLPLEVITGLLGAVLQWAQQRPAAGRVAPPGRQRVFVCDASSHSMGDAPPLCERFGLPPGTRPGVGYPVAKVMGLLDAATGMFAALLAVPLFTHDVRHALQLHPLLRAGDVLLGDRAYCSYAHLALLHARGAFGCFRLHQRRNCRRGVQRWDRPPKPPAWMTAEQFRALPQALMVRVTRYVIGGRPGFRTREVWLATTLLDGRAWPDGKLQELYGQRWHIETCFGHLKTTMGMDVLKCRSVAGVTKELAVYLLAYNLVRLAMLRAAARQQADVTRVSFADALRHLSCRMLGLSGVERLLVNPHRPGRREPRVVRRRMKEYNLMKLPRDELKRRGIWGENR